MCASGLAIKCPSGRVKRSISDSGMAEGQSWGVFTSSRPWLCSSARSWLSNDARSRWFGRLAVGIQGARGNLFVGPFDIIPGAGVDLDFIALVDKQGHLHLGTGRQRGRLGGVGGRIALDARLAIGDF